MCMSLGLLDYVARLIRLLKLSGAHRPDKNISSASCQLSSRIDRSETKHLCVGVITSPTGTLWPQNAGFQRLSDFSSFSHRLRDVLSGLDVWNIHIRVSVANEQPLERTQVGRSAAFEVELESSQRFAAAMRLTASRRLLDAEPAPESTDAFQVRLAAV